MMSLQNNNSPRSSRGGSFVLATTVPSGQGFALFIRWGCDGPLGGIFRIFLFFEILAISLNVTRVKVGHMHWPEIFQHWFSRGTLCAIDQSKLFGSAAKGIREVVLLVGRPHVHAEVLDALEDFVTERAAEVCDQRVHHLLF